MDRRREISGRAKIAVAITVALCSITHNLGASENAHKGWYRVAVTLNSQVVLPTALLKDGQEAAATIFSGIHVRLFWESHPPSEVPSACTSGPATDDLFIEIV